jgi:hypothetical protein
MIGRPEMEEFLLQRRFPWWREEIGETWRDEISSNHPPTDTVEILHTLLEDHSLMELGEGLDPDRDVFAPPPPEAITMESVAAFIKAFVDARDALRRLATADLLEGYRSELQVELREREEEAFFSEKNAKPDYALAEPRQLDAGRGDGAIVWT